MFHDLRYACRIFARNPGFAAVAILTLALGIGDTTAMFSFVNAVVLRPLALRNAARLVLVTSRPKTGSPFAMTAMTDGDFLDWRDRNHVFDGITAFAAATFSITTGGEPERVTGAVVTRGFFDTIGAAAAVGRTFSAADSNGAVPDSDVVGASLSRRPSADVVVIGASLWRRRFNADPGIAGKPILLNGTSYTVIGVTPPDFTFPGDLFLANGIRLMQPVELWTLFEPVPGYRNNATLQVVAHLKPDVTLAQARAELSTIAQANGGSRPADRGNYTLQLLPLQEWIGHAAKPLLFLLLGAVAFLLVIACTNVANLLLGRAFGRRREIAVRAAIGSSRWRLIRQLLTESVLLAVLGGAAGLLVAAWAADAAGALMPPGVLPRLGEVELNIPVLGFALAASVASGVLFGLAPAARLSKPDIVAALKSAGLTQTGRSRFFYGLIVAEVALGFVLLTGAGLLMKSFMRLTSIDPGFEPKRVLTVSLTLPEGSYPGSLEMRRFVREALDRMDRLPGVVHAGAVNWLPLGGSLLSGDFIVEGVAELPRDLIAAKPAISAAYFQAMGIPLERGRLFDDHDGERTAPVAIVTNSLARWVWPGESAVGKRIKVGFGPPADQPWVSIVGVVGDIKQTGLGETTRPALYIPWEQAPRPFLLRNVSFVMRTAADPMSVAATVRQEIRSVDTLLPLDRVQTMEQRIADSVSEPRFRSIIFASFAGLAVALVAIGLLGVIGHAVSSRTREIGVRMALGAQRVDVLRLVVREAIVITAAGIAAGAAGAAALTRLLTSFLFQVRPLDVPTFAAAAGVLVCVAAVASYVPARRASSVDPVVALRSE